MANEGYPVSFYAYNEAMRECDEARAEVERLTRERDALREQLDLRDQADEFDRDIMEKYHVLRAEVERLESELKDSYHNHYATIAQRDRAQREVERLRAKLKECGCA